TLGAPQCDDSGNVYLRYAPPGQDAPFSSVARVESDGSTQTIPLTKPSQSAQDTHVFVFAAGDDDSLHEILRTQSDGSTTGDSTAVEYVRFDSDGDLRSAAAFSQEFIPSMLLPLPSGNFFAIGVDLKQESDGVQESSVAAIFGPDA